MTDTSIIAAREDNGIARLTLNRPAKRNALNTAMVRTLLEQVQKWRRDPQIRVLIFDAAGECFCAGADIAGMREAAGFDFDENVADALPLAQLLQQIHTFPRPSLVLVRGAAYGGALGLVSAADIALCTPDARFCLSEVRLGLIPAVISPYVLEATGMRRLRRYLLTAEVIGAEEALQAGLVHEITTDPEERARHIIKDLLKGSPDAQASGKELLNHLREHPSREEAHTYTNCSIAKARASAHGREGTLAFLEKRNPDWAL